jgi:hypothetical protein
VSSSDKKSPDSDVDEPVDTEEKPPEEEELETYADEKTQEKKGFLQKIIGAIDAKNPKLGKLLRDIRVQAFLLFLFLLVLYLNLIIWDFYFSSDSVPYGLMLKEWFEKGGMDAYDLLRPAHPLTMPLAILFTYPMLPITGSNYLLSYAILDAILGAACVAAFYLVCYIFVHNRKLSLICSLGLAFSFAFWENSEMAEDKSLGFLLFILFIPILFSFMGETNPFKKFEKLKDWQKGLVTGVFMGLVLAAHVSFVLLFIFVLFLGWRYSGLKFFKSIGFVCFILGAAIVCIIVFGIVAMALEVDSLGGFIGMFTQYHTGEGGKEYFALAEPESFSLTTQLRGLAGGVFTTLFMFITQESAYYPMILAIGAILLFIMAIVLLQGRKNKVVSSFYFLMVIWFANYFFFSPDDRNAWVYLLVPVWLSICIGLDIISREGVKLILLKRKLPEKITSLLTPLVSVMIIILLINNGIVFADAHFNHDEREKFVNFAEANIGEENPIIIVDESTQGFFNYYSDIKAESWLDVVLDSNKSDYINSSLDNGDAVYLAEFWLNDSYVKEGGPRTERTYEARLNRHREFVAIFNSMYSYELAYVYEWSDIYRIVE